MLFNSTWIVSNSVFTSHKIDTCLLSVPVNLLGEKSSYKEKKKKPKAGKILISKTEHCIFYYKAYGWKYYLTLLSDNYWRQTICETFLLSNFYYHKNYCYYSYWLLSAVPAKRPKNDLVVEAKYLWPVFGLPLFILGKWMRKLNALCVNGPKSTVHLT